MTKERAESEQLVFSVSTLESTIVKKGSAQENTTESQLAHIIAIRQQQPFSGEGTVICTRKGTCTMSEISTQATTVSKICTIVLAIYLVQWTQ